MSYYVPDFKISFNNAQKGNTVRQHVTTFQISEQLQTPAEFTFTLIDEFNIKNQKFKWLDDPDLQPGNTVSLEIGYVNNLKKIIENGIIKTITTSGFSQNDAPTVTIVGYDATHDWLSKVPEIKDETTSIELTGSKVAKIVSTGAKFACVSDTTTEYSTRLTKSSSTNYGAVLKDRAASIGFEFFPSRNALYFVNPRKNSHPNHTYEWGKDIIQFVPSINTADIVASVTVRSMPNNSKTKIEGEAKTGTEDKLGKGTSASELAQKLPNPKIKEINDGNFASKAEADTKAKAELNIIGDTLVTASGSIVGNPNLELGHIITLKKLGKQFSGNYYVTKVVHSITDAGYITQFNVRNNVLGV